MKQNCLWIFFSVFPPFRVCDSILYSFLVLWNIWYVHLPHRFYGKMEVLSPFSLSLQRLSGTSIFLWRTKVVLSLRVQCHKRFPHDSLLSFVLTFWFGTILPQSLDVFHDLFMYFIFLSVSSRSKIDDQYLSHRRSELVLILIPWYSTLHIVSECVSPSTSTLSLHLLSSLSVCSPPPRPWVCVSLHLVLQRPPPPLPWVCVRLHLVPECVSGSTSFFSVYLLSSWLYSSSCTTSLSIITVILLSISLLSSQLLFFIGTVTIITFITSATVCEDDNNVMQ